MALASVANAQTAPSAYKSLQPFERFVKGDGEGVAYSYKARTKAQFVALLRDKQLAKKEMRVGCDVLVRQMMEGHQALPFEGCEGAAAAIENNNDFAVVACRDEMFQKDNFLVVTNEKGTAFNSWHRKCYKDEQVLVYKNQPLISLTCLNVAIPAVPHQVPPSASAPPAAQPPAKSIPPVFVTGECPSGFTLFVNAWSLGSLGSLRGEAEKLIQSANERDSKEAMLLDAYKPDDFSRTLGGRLRSDVKVRALITADLPIRYLDLQTAKVVRELGTIRMERGVGSFRFSDDPRAYVVEVVYPPDFASPAMSGGERRLRAFPSELGRFCANNMHGVLPQ